METWAVALACRDADVPLTVLRAVSNEAGVRDRSEWSFNLALKNLQKAMLTLFSSNGTDGEASATA
jgi:nucleoside phosphorylase